MKKLFSIALSLLLIAGLFAGCGASSNSVNATKASMPQEVARYEEAASSAPAYDMARPEAESGFVANDSLKSTSSVNLSDRKIIKNASIHLETLEFDEALVLIQQMVEKLGGYIESSDISGTSLRYPGDYNQRYANFIARIPADKLNQATSELGQHFNVLSQSESSYDITYDYYDTEGRLKSLRIKEERLLELLKKAEKLEDLITLENALADVRYQIESLTSQMNRYDNQVTYCTLSIHLQEVVETTTIKPQPRTLSEKIADAFADSLEGIVEIAEFIILTVVTIGPVLLVYGGGVALIVLVILNLTRKKGQRKNLPQPPIPPKDEM